MGAPTTGPAPVTNVRKTGRPRASAQPASGVDPVEEILAASSRLFGEHGIEPTTMSRIAAEVGLKQSSLYYYFSKKEDLVAALVARANVSSLTLAKRVLTTGESAAEQLREFVCGDVLALCALPFDINEIHRMAARDPERFVDYWSERGEIAEHLARLLRRGVRNGTFRPMNVRRTALMVMANDEGTQNWFRVDPQRSQAPDPSIIADELAAMTVAGLLATSS